MKLFADLQIHSRFSRATSNALTLPNIEKWARIKGLNLLGTGDFTHPKWLAELKEYLAEDGSGILTSKTGFKFVLQGEISNIYTQDGKGRRIHTLLLAKDFDTVRQINEKLLKKGRLDYDGRPIFGFTCIELVEMMRDISDDIEITPAHCWTPWYGIFGSMSGFDSVEECFKDQAKHIYSIETGLSSDPAMNWRLSKLDRYTLLSSSDAHSFWPWRLGRECNVFDIDLTYDNLIKAIRTKKGFTETVEVDPNYGKYHYDGHRNCNVSMSPEESKKHNGICPKCRQPMTIGVLNRVEQLADRPEGFVPKDAVPFKSLIPLSELIAALNGNSVSSQKTMKEFYNIINQFGNEFNILISANESELKKYADEKIADAIMKNREGKIRIIPGYDGVYGVPVIDGMQNKKNLMQQETPETKQQKGLHEFL
ncbi:DNA helicase UvrD [Candidatus Woesearchaeota archaeon]|nr:DNA helicase UvrD [Candidatus Woesearchaeota archaeon]